jgi:hypothetical protein
MASVLEIRIRVARVLLDLERHLDRKHVPDVAGRERSPS